MNNSILAEIKKVKVVLKNDGLCIPVYQRPYRWKEKNVSLLLEDIFEAWQNGQQSYRIGALILHKEKSDEGNIYNIVDGQQRITTLLLILKVIGDPLVEAHIDTLRYPHGDSHENIRSNHLFIMLWLKENLGERKKEFLLFLTEHCEMVEIVVDSLSEAFQMFDSQNGRGKELEAYNLLKAYHIRSMDEEDQETKILLDQRWENGTRVSSLAKGESVDILKQIFGEQLYRTRVWSRRGEALGFVKKNIEEFKGFTISQRDSAKYPFHNTHFLQLLATRHLNHIGGSVKGIKGRFNSKLDEGIDPFVSINQTIVNGKAFFDYIETYNQIYQRLFLNLTDSQELAEFKNFYKEQCLYKHNRAGDRYLCEVFKSLVFLLFDKFGEDGLMKYYKILYAIIYRVRLEKQQVKYDFVAKNKSFINAFFVINNAKSYMELLELEKKSKYSITLAKDVDKVRHFFTINNITIITDEELQVKLA
ncbi:DUF262 domain-containing protein [Pedobacter sp. KBW06]|uniref:DUF262 domain-containing protein n=1 Tax=Pedobacter sp. KBW06 TaxID=2153359 RepID=UPI000F5A7913|nr:DUF262 domain-containing protein [Pedobacter sp. KBW06]RQO66453.1 DUF262 domain-containing protein [Pedobacter sp. KBW06]